MNYQQALALSLISMSSQVLSQEVSTIPPTARSIIPERVSTPKLRGVNRNWDAERATAQVQRECVIPAPWASVEKGPDGYAHVQLSPSLTSEQTLCVASSLDRLEIETR